MSNKREIYKDDITKLIDGKSLDEVIENLKELRNSNYGCEVIKLKLTTNYKPCISLYDIVNEIPSNIDLNRNPALKKDDIPSLKIINNYTLKDVPIISLGNLPNNFFMDVSYFKEVYNIELNAKDVLGFINNLKSYYKHSRNRVFVRYGEGPADAAGDGIIAGFTIINLDSITSDKLDITVFNPYYTKYLIGKQGTKARELASKINKELGYERVKKIFFKEIK